MSDTALLIIWGVWVGSCWIFIFRNELVFHIREEARMMAPDLVDSGPSYDRMVLDLRKWTARQFYPSMTAWGSA